MEKAKKESADWNISATHYLTAGFAIPVIFMILSNIFLLPLLKVTSVSLVLIFTSGVNFLGIFLGVLYSAGYVQKTYIIKNVSKVINLSSLYYVVIGLGLILYRFFEGKLDIITSVYYIVFLTIGANVFYFASKKFLQNNS